MILYHGSDHIIEKPVFGEGKSYNDYGRGFYCTEHVDLKSKKAFDALTFVEGIKAPREEYFAKYKQRDEEARGKYRTIATKPVAEDATYVIDIIRNNWKNGQGI